MTNGAESGARSDALAGAEPLEDTREATDIATRILLLIEDNPGDAQLVQDLLSQTRNETYTIVHTPSVLEAVAVLRKAHIDVVVLDLGLPDCAGVDTVRIVRETVGQQTPIVVLTGSDDEALARACIDAGAQDYLPKNEVRARNLSRAIGYAITRVREAQLRELQATMARYRSMSSATQGTTVTAALAGSGAVSLRSPEQFREIVDMYFRLFEPYLAQEGGTPTSSRAYMERIITALGDASGGPRDLLDLHVAALDRALARRHDPGFRAVVLEARLIALEMMGMLVDYYRVGQRRRFAEGVRP